MGTLAGEANWFAMANQQSCIQKNPSAPNGTPLQEFHRAGEEKPHTPSEHTVQSPKDSS
jgi:hypothetical protein